MTQRPQIRNPTGKPHWSLWVAIAVGLVWCAMFLNHPLWPSDVVPLDSELNGPRWFLLLVPDQTVASWIDGPVDAAGLLQRGAVLVVALVLIGSAWLAGRLIMSAVPPMARMNRTERIALATASGLALQSCVTVVVGLAGGIGRGWSVPLVILMTFGVGMLVGRASGRFSRRKEPTSSAPSDAFPQRSLRPGRDVSNAPSPQPSPPPAKKTQAFLAGEGEGAENANPKKKLRQSSSSEDREVPEADSEPAWASWVPRFAFAALAVLLVARSMMPPAEYDVREYHLQAPKEWSQAGRISFMPHNIYANMPMAAEMHAVLAMDAWRWIRADREAWWWGALSGKVHMAGYMILAAIILGEAVRRVRTPLAGRWTSVLVMSMPALFEGASLGLIEASVACFFSAGLLVVAGVWQSEPGRGILSAAAWLGFFAGAAMACKYPALLFVALPLGLACWFLRTERSWPTKGLRVGCFALVALLICAPWYLKNAVSTGNPVYPLAASVFGGKTMTSSKIAQWNAAHRPNGFGADAVVASAKRLSWRWQTQSMILIPLALVGAVATWRERPTRWILIALAITLLVWWMLTHRIERFLVPSLPLVFVLAGMGWSSLRKHFGLYAATLVVLFGVGMDSMLVAGPLLGDSRLAVNLAALREGEAIDEGVSSTPEHVRYVNETLSSTDRVLLVGDAAAFDYAVPVAYSTTFDESPLARVLATHRSTAWGSALRRRGYTHVLVHWGEIDRLRATYGFDPRITREQLSEMRAVGALVLERADLTGGVVELYRVAETGRGAG